ncbi:RNA polymerase subunit sigma-24 [Bordetella sp. H567]|uniref:RNA polymerase sigma factor n=1 Tax=Bordetella sp. H567 TaxID=1697043 RepID=UPI00081C97FD|nr:RNA polymerase sigma factor [Bordetella sp. H567]AOB32576.1 RNA polymerase subunit sigma-24 [Bordetella sp. H567]
MNPAATHAAIDAVWRREAAKVIAGVARLVRDVGLAEDYAQDALVAALEHWPRTGVPDNPGAWLMTTAKHRALDRLRQDALHARKQEQLAQDMDALETSVEPDFVDALDAARQDDIGDDLLRLVFTACHPVLSMDARVALTLRLLCGLTTDEIARAFLVGEPTIAQRIVRAKRTLSKANVPFEVPPAHLRAQRLASVLEVIYLVFNEGYAATAGDDWMRPALCQEAIRLGGVLAGLAPGESEVHGLVALMELQASRLHARVDAQGAPVLLADQDRGRWDREQIRRGLDALARAEALGGQGPYVLQAALAACHARAPTADATDWARIVALYDLLMQRAPSPVVALNRAVAVSMAQGPAEALPLVQALGEEPALRKYPWLPSVRGDLLARLGRKAQARAAFEEAAAMTRNTRDRDMLLARARALDDGQ